MTVRPILTAPDPRLQAVSLDVEAVTDEIRRLADDMADSISTLNLIWDCWRAKPGTLLIPGHDLTMTLDEKGQPCHLGERAAGIRVWFTENIEHSDVIDLTKI